MADQRRNRERFPTYLQLAMLAAVASEGSILGAAERFNVSPQTVRDHIERLERHVGDPTGASVECAISLVTPRGALTAEGERLLAATRPALRAFEGLQTAMGHLRTGGRYAKVACYPAQVPHAATAALTIARHSEPVEIELQEVDDELRLDGGSRLVEMLREGIFDVVVVPERTAKELGTDLTTRWLYEWTLVAVGEGPQGASIDVRKLDEWARRQGNRVMVGPKGLTSRKLVEDYLPFMPVRFESASVGTLYALVQRKFGVALMPGDAIPLQGRQGNEPRARAVVVDGWNPVGHAYVALTRGVPKDAAPARFVDEFRRVIRTALQSQFVKTTQTPRRPPRAAGGI